MNLSELIETHKGRRSYPDLARDCGGKVTGKRIQQLVRDSIKNFPDPPTLAALAKGLRVPQRAVVLAAAESLGLQVNEAAPRLVQLLPIDAARLNEEQAAAIAHLVDVIVNDPLRTTPEQDEGAPTEPGKVVPIEPTVKAVLAAQDEACRHLRAVADGGEPSHEQIIDELARQARLEQTGAEE